MTTTINYIGHSAFFITSKNNCGILIDPFISGNSKAIFKANPQDIKDIFVTHGHADHLGDAIPISRQTKANIYAIFELANYCAQQGAFTTGLNMGGKIPFEWGWAKFLPAFHSSSTPDGKYAGMPASILFNINGLKIYHAGDTCLHSEMKTIGEIYKPDITILPIGSCYTMDIDDAVIAAQWLGAKTIIPMHYNTFDAISVDNDSITTKFNTANIHCKILAVGESVEF